MDCAVNFTFTEIILYILCEMCKQIQIPSGSNYCNSYYHHKVASLTTKPKQPSTENVMIYQQLKMCFCPPPSKIAGKWDFVMTWNYVFLFIYTEVMRQCLKQIFKSWIRQHHSIHVRSHTNKHTGQILSTPLQRLSSDVTLTGSWLELSVCAPQTQISSGTLGARCVRCITLKHLSCEKYLPPANTSRRLFYSHSVAERYSNKAYQSASLKDPYA